MPECLILRVRDRKVVSITAYVDRLHVLEELGIAPQVKGDSTSADAS